ncbi:hypothetical protein RF11_07371 [Thelohanellus kitauei]|uniref:Uncharacterized protein n=1 Tax=Thelohanellus kitauei TaxID=669202 RepID=A0A0C2I623_THEKT|nr:hypothetical protein RF11_07371 [Thelohanellus kitauei]
MVGGDSAVSRGSKDKLAPRWSWLDAGWCAILSPLLEPSFMSYLLLYAEGNSDAVSDSGNSRAPNQVSYSLSFMSLNPDSVPHLRISGDTVDLYLNAIKNHCEHPSASEESRRVQKYPEDKKAFKIILRCLW